MDGRAKCEVLKEIRRQQALALGIDLHQRECKFQGECKGTCPKCKAEELRLNAALLKKKALALGGAVGVALSLTACSGIGQMPYVTEGDAKPLEGEIEYVNDGNGGDDLILEGEIEMIDPSIPGGNSDEDIYPIEGGMTDQYVVPDEPYELEGDVAYDPYQLEGDVAYDPEYLNDNQCPNDNASKSIDIDSRLDKMFSIDFDN